MRDSDARIAAQHRFLLELPSLLAEYSTDLPAGSEAVVRALYESQDFEVLLLRLRRGPWLELGAVAGLDEEEAVRVRAERPLLGEGGLAASAAREGETRLVADTRELKPRLQDPTLTGFRSQLVVPLKDGDGVAGVLDLRARVQDVFDEVDARFLEAVAGQVTLALRAHKLSGQVTAPDENGGVSVESLRSLAHALEQADPYFSGHSDRVSWIAHELTVATDLSPAEAALLETAAELHDVGMMGIPDTIVQKPGRLDDQERTLVEVHTKVGERLCALLPDGEKIGAWVAAHHEHWDGSGYPRGLEGEDIPFPARVITLADTYDALTSDRPFRAALGYAEALAELKAGAGTMFDPGLIDVLLKLAPDLERILAERSRFLVARKTS